MDNQNPFFSVIIPVFNRASLISETVDSVLHQEFKSFEVIIVNDGSTDNTPQVLSQYGTSIFLVHQKNDGPEAARNTGVSFASGEYLVFLDSDDILLPEALSIYHRLIEKEKYPALLFAKGMGFGSNNPDDLNQFRNRQIEYMPIKDYLSKRVSVWLSTSFLILKRSYWNSETCFKSGTFPVDDLDFLLRSGTCGRCLIINAPVTVGYRYHEGNSVYDIEHNIDSLTHVLQLERSGTYPGGWKRKIDRLAVIGGHIISWCIKGFRKKLYKKSLFLLMYGFSSVIAALFKKVITICFFLPMIKHRSVAIENQVLIRVPET